MKKLLGRIRRLKSSKVKQLVDSRIREFKENGKKPINEIFKELCFCILTANFNAEKSIKIQKDLGGKFLTLTEPGLAIKLRELGHRFPNARAKYIIDARKHKNFLKNAISSLNRYELREWLVKNIKGISYKEASHFLRNIGYDDYAIIDFHIIDALAKHNLLKKPKTVTRKKYLEIEGLLEKIAGKLNLSLAELDLYLWYAETGKVLK